MICIPITSASGKKALRDIKRSCQIADCIELRMDLIGRGSLAELIRFIRNTSRKIRIIVTCRRKEEAAPSVRSADRTKVIVRDKKEKMALFKEAVELNADFVDIELAEGNRAIRDLKALCAEKGGRTNIIVSYHNLKDTPPLVALKKIFQQCAKFKPTVVKIVTTAKTVEDNLVALELISYAKEHSQKIISLCMGEKGVISRVIAPVMGNFLSFATLDRNGQSAPGQFTVQQMNKFKDLIGDRHSKSLIPSPSLSKVPPKNFVLLGNPVGHSLSPLMHNAALKKIGIEEQYSACCVQDIGCAIEGIRGMNIRGASVTIPFKVAVMEYLDDIDDDALAIGAVNTIVNDGGRLTGYNTDWLGFILTLKKAMTIKNKTFAIIGAGGAARAAGYGIVKEGGFPVIANLIPDEGKILAAELNCAYYPLCEAGKIEADCLINATPVGMYPQKNKSPMKTETLAGYKCVMDVIYNPLKTKLLADAEKQGCKILSGIDMFVNQGAEQLRLWTGKEPPFALMKKIILKRLMTK
jgi:shikimate dehydrogenase/3-dehydroquinate dehydratase type I